MATKRHKPEEIVTKLRQIEVLAGQICTATERILVHKSVHDRFVEGLVKVAQTRRSGDPFDPENNLGPLNNAPTLDKMNRHMEDARASGAQIVHGGNPASGKATNLFYEPTVVTGLTDRNLLNVEESFGPVAPVLTFSDMDEALALAASSPYGLSAALFTGSTKNAFRYAEALLAAVAPPARPVQLALPSRISKSSLFSSRVASRLAMVALPVLSRLGRMLSVSPAR